MHIEKKYFWGHKCLSTYTARAVSNRSGFEIKHRKTYPFLSQIGSSIATFKDTHSHLLV